MKKIWKVLAKDLWIVLLDIIAVNAAYYLALIIRFFVGGQLRAVASTRYMPAWMGFAPWYTILALIIFMAFRLYGGMWRYAGINDMNRIILANLCTAIVQVAGTMIFFTRMPITYYVIGTVLQFLMIVAIRFGYRVLLVEKRRLKRGERINTVVVGSGENGRRVVKNLEESELYRPTYIYSTSKHNGVMDGIPIKSEFDLSGIGAVFIADPLMIGQEREKIRTATEEAGLEFHDYTGYFSNLGGKLSLTELLSTIHSPVVIEMDGVGKRFEDGAQALKELNEKYTVVEVTGVNMVIKLEKQQKLDKKKVLEDAYAAVMGDGR